MGQSTLALPTTGTLYVDTQILIYSVEKHPTYGPLLEPVWRAARGKTLAVETSELTLMEALVTPIRLADAALRRHYESVLLSADMRLTPITLDVLRAAATLRASVKSLRTPDAIHAATAIEHSCALFLTNDAGFRHVPGLPITVLDDMIRP